MTQNRSVRICLDFELIPETTQPSGSKPPVRTHFDWSKELVLHSASHGHGPLNTNLARPTASVELRGIEEDTMHLWVFYLDDTWYEQIDDETRTEADRRVMVWALPPEIEIDETSGDIVPEETIRVGETLDLALGTVGYLFHPSNTPLYQVMDFFVSSTRPCRDRGFVLIRLIDPDEVLDGEWWFHYFQFVETPEHVPELYPS